MIGQIQAKSPYMRLWSFDGDGFISCTLVPCKVELQITSCLFAKCRKHAELVEKCHSDPKEKNLKLVSVHTHPYHAEFLRFFPPKAGSE